MDYFVLTDHDTMSGYESLLRELPAVDQRLVIPAVEHALFEPTLGFSIHINLFQLDPDTYADLRRRVETLTDLADFCAQRHIYMQYNHPTWWERDEIRAGVVDVTRVPEAARHFTVLELNAGRTPALNRVTENLARSLGKHLTAGSDTHTGEVGRAYTEAPGQTAASFLAGIWQGKATPSICNMSYRGMLAMIHGMIDDVFDHRRAVRVRKSAMDSGNPNVERLTRSILGSNRVMRNGWVREPLRCMLKQVARPIVWNLLAHERQLERELRASDLHELFESTIKLQDPRLESSRPESVARAICTVETPAS